MIPPNSTDEPSWLTRARREIGVQEIVGGRHNPRVLDYHSHTRLQATTDEVPWCAAFVNWALEREGVRSTKSAAAASYLTWGKPTYPEPGCIVVFGKSHPDAVGTGHVGFLVGIEGDQLLVLGGNQGNKVCIRKYPAEKALAYRWPVF